MVHLCTLCSARVPKPRHHLVDHGLVLRSVAVLERVIAMTSYGSLDYRGINTGSERGLDGLHLLVDRLQPLADNDE